LTLDTKNVSFISIYFAQLLKYVIIDEIKAFREKVKTILNEDDYKYLMHTKISYGMGIHKGEVEVYPFEYKLFDEDYTNYAFISNVINIASRIEQSTKDHGRKIICSKVVYANFESEYFIYKRRHIDAENYFDRLGGHKYKGVDCLIYIYGVKPGLFATEAKEALMNNEI